MTYATKENLTARFGEAEILQLADRDGDSIEDSGVIESALADTDALIDSYLGVRYDVPLAPVPAVVTSVAADIARAKLWTDEPPEGVKEAHKAALGWLQRVADGRAIITGASGKVEAGASDDAFKSTTGTRRFDSDTLSSYLGRSKP